MADLDFLRDINNTHGHMAGDAVICGIAGVFREHLRRYDVAARFGGEEFSILLPETHAAEAMQIAERIRAAVAERAFTVDTTATTIHASMSIGVSASTDGAIGPREFVHQADLAVYEAKAAGRNRVALAKP
jgi:diguanylate cyclase (GGDEF)-like protein